MSFRGGGHFTLLLTNVEDAYLHDLDIAAARDGIDLMGLRHVVAERLHIHGGGDDAFKLGSDWSIGRQLDSYNITLRDSVLSSGEQGSGLGCQCIQFGSETSGNFYDMIFSNISCMNAGKAGIGITSMDGANISNMTFKDIQLHGTTEPIHMYIGARAWERRPPPFNVGSISNIRFINIRADHVKGKPPSFRTDTNFTTTIDGQGVSANVSTVHPITDIHFSNLSIHYEGGGIASDATKYAKPYHNPNDGGPRSSGAQVAGQAHGVRPSFGLFLRHLHNSLFEDVRLSFADNDDRPAVILIYCSNITFRGDATWFERGVGSGFDVGVRNSSSISVVASDIRVCTYPRCPDGGGRGGAATAI
eukprot:SAG31_NODE_4579_length_3121_cov_1.314692_1_plen_361_part_00